MRLIDADALIDKTDDRYSLHEIGRKERDDIVDALEYAPTIQPEPHWIPVTEQLPKENGSYLVSGKWGSGKESVGDCEFSVEDGYFQTAWNFDVLAWCELPEPYKGVTT